MKRVASAVVLIMLVMVVFPSLGAAQAQGGLEVRLVSHFYLDRYGYAIVNETVTFKGNSTGSVLVPDVQLSLGSMTSLVASYIVYGSGYSATQSGPTFTVSGGGQSVSAGGKSSFTLSAILNGVVSTAANRSLQVLLLENPSLSIPTDSFVLIMALPSGTIIAHPPRGFVETGFGTNSTYSRSGAKSTFDSPSTAVRVILADSATSMVSDLHPLQVYSASRTVSIGPDGNPLVTDQLSFKNLGRTQIASLTIAPLTASGGRVTIKPSTEPRLLSPTSVALSGFSIDLTNSRVGFPAEAGANYNMAYQYPLGVRYYSVSGGVIKVNMPNTPPISAFVDSYSISSALPAGVKLLQGQTQTIAGANPRQTGETTVSYTLTPGWAVDDGIPAASLIFVLMLAGLFLSRTTLTEEEETEEESSTERASAMIQAFEEKTILINGLWAEIRSADPNDLGKEYFDETRGRLDAFRSRALQRLNEVKQKSTTQKFFDLLNQIHATEREVERAAKDTLNLYEQFYTRRMRKEVFDRLSPQYTKRLEKALNQLSDELHVVQREAKLL